MNGEVIREPKDTNFTVVSNDYIHDHDLSLTAKGLLTVMLSLPDTWNYSQKGLAKITGESEYCIKRLVDELTSKGYLEIIRCKPTKASKGRITYRYVIRESIF